MRTFSPIAVQHERGPRKPKLHQSALMAPPHLSHHLMKDSLKLSPGQTKFPSAGSVFSKPLGGGGGSSGSSGRPGSPLGRLGSPLGLDQPPPPSFFQPASSLAPPPALLHILMSAEKYQVNNHFFTLELFIAEN